MEWITCVRKAIDFMEHHLTDNISAQDVAEQVYLSPFMFQRGFALTTGFGIGEYIRNRRLYQAAVDLQQTSDKVIDIALRYCYETPESFTKAFSRFHGATPSQIRCGAPIRHFLPLTIQITIQGGSLMDYKVKNMFAFKVIGFQKVFNSETAYAEIPKFWNEIWTQYFTNMEAGNPPANPCETAITENGIGEFGICIDDIGNGKFRYLIAGKYTGGDVPDGMTVYEFPQCDWAIFNCIGPMPDALQELNTRIFREWLPGNSDYEFYGNANIEWYDRMSGSSTDPDYHSAIWVPVRKKH